MYEKFLSETLNSNFNNKCSVAVCFFICVKTVLYKLKYFSLSENMIIMKMMIFSDLINFFSVMAASSSPVSFKAMQIKSGA